MCVKEEEKGFVSGIKSINVKVNLLKLFIKCRNCGDKARGGDEEKGGEWMWKLSSIRRSLYVILSFCRNMKLKIKITN